MSKWSIYDDAGTRHRPMIRLTEDHKIDSLLEMSEERASCAQCGEPLDPASETADLLDRLCQECAQEPPPPPGPDLRSWLLFGALVSGGPDDVGDQ